jgi:hypothetical protein
VRVMCFSSFTFGYLNRARVLFETVKRYHADWDCVALITDRPPAGLRVDVKKEPFDRVIYANDLSIDAFDSWIFKHDIVEACTAIKGPFMNEASKTQTDAIIYLDPDIALFSPLDEITGMLESSDIILTPHLLDPDDDDIAIRDNEITALKAGIYNLGFVAVRTRDEGLRFARWWGERCLRYCYDDVESGLFVDQRWCDHVPSFFDRVKILKHPGCNVASWNLSNRRLKIHRDGTITVNGSPLRFWHFTKLGKIGDTMTKRYAADNFHVYELWRWYKERVLRHTEGVIPSGYWAYRAYDNGDEILKPDRILYRSRPELQAMFPRPFRCGEDSYHEYLRQRRSSQRLVDDGSSITAS